MFIRKLLNGTFDREYIERRFGDRYNTMTFAKLQNQNIVILSEQYNLNDRQVVFDEEVKRPLYKQAMDMQMGKPYKPKDTHRTVRYIDYIDPEKIHGNMRFEVYEHIGY